MAFQAQIGQGRLAGHLADSPGPNARYHQDELNSHPITARIVAVGETSDQTPRLALPSCVFSISFPGDPMEVTRPSLTGSTLTPHISAAVDATVEQQQFLAGEMGHELQDCGLWGPGLVGRPVPSPVRVTSPSRVPNSEQAGTRLRASYGQVRQGHLSSQPFGFASR